MPLQTAIPPSEMNPTKLATVSVCWVMTRANTPPMNAVGIALRICNTIRGDPVAFLALYRGVLFRRFE